MCANPPPCLCFHSIQPFCNVVCGHPGPIPLPLSCASAPWNMAHALVPASTAVLCQRCASTRYCHCVGPQHLTYLANPARRFAKRSASVRTYVEDSCSDGSSGDADGAGFGGAITSPVKLAEICSKHAEVVLARLCPRFPASRGPCSQERSPALSLPLLSQPSRCRDRRHGLVPVPAASGPCRAASGGGSHHRRRRPTRPSCWTRQHPVGARG